MSLVTEASAAMVARMWAWRRLELSSRSAVSLSSKRERFCAGGVLLLRVPAGTLEAQHSIARPTPTQTLAGDEERSFGYALVVHI